MRQAILIASMPLVLMLSAVEGAAAAPILLTGLSDSGLTATVDNYTLAGNVFAFDLTNTSPGFIITNFGDATGGLSAVQLPFVLQTNVPTALIPSSRWLFVQPPGVNPAFPTIPQPPDWGLFITQFNSHGPDAIGLPANQTFHFAFTLSQTGGLDAFQLADALTIRLRNDPNVNSDSLTDIVGTFPHTAAVPEPTSVALLITGFLTVGLRRRRAKSCWQLNATSNQGQL